MADLLISPEGYSAPGTVPRKLLAGVFLVVAAAAMAVFLLTTPDEAPMTGDQKARAALKEPDRVRTQSTSNPQWIDEAASAAIPVAQAPAVHAPSGWPVSSRESSSGEPGMAHAPAPLPALPPARGVATPVAAGGPGADVDAGAVERERVARSAATTVFDAAADDGRKVSRSPAGMAGLPDDMGRRDGASPDADALAPVIAAIKATHGAASPAATEETARDWARSAVSAGDTGVLRASPRAADLLLYQGTVIPCVLTRRINSDLPGVVTARVSMDVYDSRTSRHLLLPKGSLLSGAYNNDVKAGQSRLQFAFNRLRLPDGSTFELPGATGSDAAGQAGIEGDVDRHFFRSFGAALLLGVLADQVTRVAALPHGGANGQGGVSATGQVFIDTARAELERHKDIPPTVTIPEGSRIHVEVVRDMAFGELTREMR